MKRSYAEKPSVSLSAETCAEPNSARDLLIESRSNSETPAERSYLSIDLTQFFPCSLEIQSFG